MSMTTKQENSDILHELENLKEYLQEDLSVDGSDIPLLKDVATIPVTPRAASPVTQVDTPRSACLTESMKEKIRQQAGPLIQEFVDREMIEMEQRLIKHLNEHLEKWMESGDQ